MYRVYIILPLKHVAILAMNLGVSEVLGLGELLSRLFLFISLPSMATVVSVSSDDRMQVKSFLHPMMIM